MDPKFSIGAEWDDRVFVSVNVQCANTGPFRIPLTKPSAKTPPVETPPVETPPVETPPVETLPMETLPKTYVEAKLAIEKSLSNSRLTLSKRSAKTLPVETPPVETLPVETLPKTYSEEILAMEKAFNNIAVTPLKEPRLNDIVVTLSKPYIEKPEMYQPFKGIKGCLLNYFYHTERLPLDLLWTDGYIDATLYIKNNLNLGFQIIIMFYI